MLVSLLIACTAESPPVLPSDAVTSEVSTELRRRQLVAAIQADVVAGAYPLEVAFDSVGSRAGAGGVTFEWDFGDGTTSSASRTTAHTFIGAGTFVVRVTLTDASGAVASAEVEIDVTTPACPTGDVAVMTGHVDDASLDELSGIAVSPTDPDLVWVHEDGGNDPMLVAMTAWGQTMAEHNLPDDFPDFEDLAVALDPDTGAPLLFLGDIGDNAYARTEVAVWVADEPALDADSDIFPFRMGLEYPDGPRNAETLLVDPRTLDVYIVTKETWSAPDIYVKRAPHVEGGPYVLESLGSGSLLPYTATGGAISADGAWIVVRDYGATAFLFPRDGYLPLENAFSSTVCPVAIHSEGQGEAVTFSPDGTSILTVSEGVQQPMYRIDL